MGEPTRRRRSAMSSAAEPAKQLPVYQFGSLSFNLHGFGLVFGPISRARLCGLPPSACYIDRSQTLPLMKFFP